MSSRQLTLRLRYFASREYHSLTNSDIKISIYKKAIGYSDSLFMSCPTLIGYLLFSFLEVFDLGEDFIGLSDDLAVYAEADDTSDDTSDCGKYQDHNTA